MSTLQCSNIHLESSANNRLQYLGTNTIAVVVGGTNSFVANTTTTTIVTGSAVNLLANSTVSSIQVNGSNSLVANTTATALTVGATVVAYANATSFDVNSNSFYVGSYSNAASGYTILPNLIKMNWGIVTPNSVGQNVITFSSAFTTNVYAVSFAPITSINSVTTTTRSVTGTGCTLYIANSGGSATNTGTSAVYYTAIGPV